MKKLYNLVTIVLFSTILSFTSRAEMHFVTVGNGTFTFQPSALTVNVGDTIMWMWTDFAHTTTADVIPAGADAWDSPLDQTTPMFMYPVTVAGSYSYYCTPHQSMGMTGTFDAIDNTGIETPQLASGFNVYQVSSSAVKVDYNLANSTNVKISVYDLTGKVSQVLLTGAQTPGTYNETYSLEAFSKGIYLVELLAGDQKITKRMIIQ